MATIVEYEKKIDELAATRTPAEQKVLLHILEFELLNRTWVSSLSRKLGKALAVRCKTMNDAIVGVSAIEFETAFVGLVAEGVLKGDTK